VVEAGAEVEVVEVEGDLEEEAEDVNIKFLLYELIKYNKTQYNTIHTQNIIY